MFKFVVLLTVFACALAATKPRGLLPQLDGRIVGGADTTIRSFPYQISLQRSGAHSCGGSVYNTNFIVTAAHCVQGSSISMLKVRAGSSYWNSGGVLLTVAEYKIHEGYDPYSMINDIAVMRLASPLTFSSTIKPIALAITAPPNDAPAVVSGWGTRQSGAYSVPTQLRYVNMKIVSLAACGSPTYGYDEDDLRETMICTYSVDKDSCQGDSGGPLVSDGELVGIVSWGYGCAFKNLPGVYSDVAALRPWVEENVKLIEKA